MGLLVRPASAHLEYLERFVRSVSRAADGHRYHRRRTDRSAVHWAAIVGIVAGDVFNLRRVSGVVVAEGQGLRGSEVNGDKPQRNGEDIAEVAEDFLDSSANSSASSAVEKAVMSGRAEQTIDFENVSKFYGEILGVNRVTLSIPPGITSLVGPNGAGKTTLMNLMTGLLRPTRGTVTVLGIPTDRPEELFRKVGYCSQFDSFPRGLTGREFIGSFLMVSGFSKTEAEELATKALERVDLLDAG